MYMPSLAETFLNIKESGSAVNGEKKKHTRSKLFFKITFSPVCYYHVQLKLNNYHLLLIPYLKRSRKM